MSASVKVNTHDIDTGMTELITRANVALMALADTGAKQMEGYAKEHRPWTDRSGRARQGLTGYTDTETEKIYIYLAQTVDYGLWLELANEKKYAVIDPTLKAKSPEIISSCQNLLNQIHIK